MRQPNATRDESFLLAEVAHLYYGEELTQEQIAQETGVSRSNVSRMLKEARERGIVEIRVHYPLQTVPRLEHELRERLGLADCLVLATGQHGSGIDVGEGVPQRVGALAARYLQKHVQDHSTVGLGWGTMVCNVVNSGFLAQKRGMTVVQIQGSVGGAAPETDGARIVSLLGRALGAPVYYLNAPMAVADAAVRIGLLRDQYLRETLEIGRCADTLIVGVGAVSPRSGLYRAGYLNDADLDHIRGQGAVGDVCGSYFGRDGSPCPLELNDRMITLGSEAMRTVPRRVGVSCGVEKALPNVGAARSGLINVLETDEHAAEEMLDLIKQEVVRPPAAVPR